MKVVSPHVLDERYDGVMGRVALAGGLAAVPQIVDRLGRSRTRSMVGACERYDLGERVPLGGSAPTTALRLSARTVAQLLDRPGGRLRLSGSGIVQSVRRFAYHARAGRPALRPSWVIDRVLAEARARLAERLNAFGERITRLRSSGHEGRARREYERWRHMRARVDTLATEAVQADLAAAARMRGLYLDPAPSGLIGVFIDQQHGVAAWRKLLQVMTRFALTLDEAVRLEVLCGSAYDVSVAERHRDRALREHARGKLVGVVPERLEIECVDLGTARLFVHHRQVDSLLVSADAARLARLGEHFGSKTR